MSGRLELPDFALETFFSQWEFKARHHLTASDAESMSVSDLLALGDSQDRRAWEQLHLGYIPTWGSEELRSAIAGTYEHLDTDDVLAFAGAGEALFWAMQLFVEPGDHVIVTVPNYQSIESVPVAAGVDVEGLPLWTDADAKRRWSLDLDRFENMLRPETTLVSVNFPNNPTGFVPDHATWRTFNALCHERGIRVVSDEVYRGIETDPTKTLTPAASINPTALSVSVMSKAYGLPGLRIGWVATRDHAALERLERAKHYTSICNSAPSEHLATIALRHGQTILDRNRRLVAQNDTAVKAFLDEFPGLIDYSTPDGGCVAFPRYLGDDSVETFCTRAIEQDGVMMLPASIYRSGLADVPQDHFRIGIGRVSVPESLDALGKHLRRRAGQR